jgi:hypothetical protein
MSSKKRLKHQREKKCRVCKERKQKYLAKKSKQINSEENYGK